MSQSTDVLFKIKYKKNGVIEENDILDNIDLYDAILEITYNKIVYENEKNKILRTMSNYAYFGNFLENEGIEELFEILRKYEIQNLYFIYCNYSEILDFIIYGIINVNVLENEIYGVIDKKERYFDILKNIYGDNIIDKIEESEENWDEKSEKFEEERWEKVNQYCYKNFLEYLKKVELNKKMEKLEVFKNGIHQGTISASTLRKNNGNFNKNLIDRSKAKKGRTINEK